jgi:hypothetical protein
MHGDEPTHTAVVLDLLNLLQTAPTCPVSADILSGCTLHVIPMLNPDGAQRFTRRNVQDIDVNRDARDQQTPEGRILKAAQEELRPDFGFNLHDQDHRTTVGRTKRVAAVSLLVPPFDVDNSENETTARARRMASWFRQAVEPYCEGMVARYDAEYMPRAFGDSMQSWGVSTILVEAGGWPGRDRAELVRVHYTGLVSTLQAIATDAYRKAEPAAYETLARSGEHDLFDLMITDATIVNGLGHPPFVADIGINVERDETDPQRVVKRGVIADLGDLGVTTGKRTIDGAGLVCIPGLIGFESEIGPDGWPAETEQGTMLRDGLTSVIGVVPLRDRVRMKQLGGGWGERRPRLHVGFVGVDSPVPAPPSESDHDDLVFGLSRDILAVDPGDKRSLCARYATWFGIPLLCRADLGSGRARDGVSLDTIDAIIRCTRGRAEPLGLSDRGVVRRKAVADLVLWERPAGWPDVAFERDDLRYVIVNGVVVVDPAGPALERSGDFLRPRGRIETDSPPGYTPRDDDESSKDR